MPKISGLVNISNNEPNLGRALESLRVCDEILVVDHGAGDQNLEIARQHGARIIKGVNGVNHGAYAQDVEHDWIFCLLPTESIAEDLEASLLEWKQSEPPDGPPGYSIGIREQNGRQWKLLPEELRLANRKKLNWISDCPPGAPSAPKLAGYILRIPRDI